MKRFFLAILIITLFTSSFFGKDIVKIAILDFKGINVEEYVPIAVVEILSTSFIDSKAFEVIERNQLQKVMGELSLQTSDDFDETIAQDIGDLLGAEIIIIGSVTKLGSRITVNIRGIQVGTGKAQFAKKINTNSLDELPDLIDDLVNMITGKKTSEEIRVEKDKKGRDFKKYDKELKTKLSTLNKAGIGMAAAGGTIVVAGIAIFLTNELYIGPKVDEELDKAFTGDGIFQDYQSAYSTYLALFITGITSMGIGGCIAIASIPMIVNKKKNVSFNLEAGNNLSFVCAYKF